MKKNWHLLPLSEIAKKLKTTLEGIDNAEAAQRLIEYGKNQLADKKKKTI